MWMSYAKITCITLWESKTKSTCLNHETRCDFFWHCVIQIVLYLTGRCSAFQEQNISMCNLKGYPLNANLVLCSNAGQLLCCHQHLIMHFYFSWSCFLLTIIPNQYTSYVSVKDGNMSQKVLQWCTWFSKAIKYWHDSSWYSTEILLPF